MELPVQPVRSPAAIDGANAPPAFCDVNLFDSDRALCDAMRAASIDVASEQLSAFGADWGSARSFELGRLANENIPRLKVTDSTGAPFGYVEFHPAWHELMQRSMAAGLHCSTWTGGTHVARAAQLYMAVQAEAGHMCPITMTHAALAALDAEPDIRASWHAKISSRIYDPTFCPWWEKASVTLGMGMTERQGGTDVRANITRAVAHRDHYAISGHKWFMSAPMCDAFLVPAQASDGLTCFLMPRFRPDGSLNTLRFVRLKDKLGNRSNASSEVEFDNAYAWRIGAEGRGVRTIIQMAQLTRLDCVISSAGLMRFALASAANHCRHRKVFGAPLAQQPAMRATLADMALDAEAACALAMILANAFDSAPDDEQAAAYARIMTPAIKFHVCKLAPGFIYEAMECHGGNDYVEEWPLARAYREAPVNAIWEGSGNVMALDVLRAISRTPEAARALIGKLAGEGGVRAQRLAVAIEQALQSEDPAWHARHIAGMLAQLAALAALRRIAPDVAVLYDDVRCAGWVSAHPGARPRHALDSMILDRLALN